MALRSAWTGEGAWRDNVFVERLWKTIKYEEVYLHAYDTVAAAKAGLARYIDFYNQRRPHRALDGVTPDAMYFDSLPLLLGAQPAGLHLISLKICLNRRGHLCLHPRVSRSGVTCCRRGLTPAFLRPFLIHLRSILSTTLVLASASARM